MEFKKLKRVQSLSRHFVEKVVVALQSVACFLRLGLLLLVPLACE